MPVAVYGNRHYDDAVLELKTLGEAAGCVTLGAAAFVAQHCLNPDMGRGRPDASDLAVMKRFACSAARRWPCRFHAASDVPGAVRTRSTTDAVRARVAGRRNLYPLRPVRPDVPGRIIDSETYAVTEPERCLFCFGCVRICRSRCAGRVPKSRPCSPLKWRDWQPDVRSAASRELFL